MKKIGFGIIFIIAGSSGIFVLRGTKSTGWLIAVGVILIVWGIIEMVINAKTKENIAEEIASGKKSDETPISETPKPTGESDKGARATVYVYRISAHAGSLNPHYIDCDGTTVANLSNGSYAILQVPEGQHIFKTSASSSSITLDIKPGEKYFIKSGIKGLIKSLFETVLVGEGERDILSLKRIPNESININFRVDE